MQRLSFLVILMLATAGLAQPAFRELSLASHPLDDIFAQNKALALSIRINADDIDKLRNNSRQYVLCTISTEGVTNQEGGVRLKGQSTFQPVDQKPSFALKFDAFSDEKSLRGRKKLLFNNSSQDHTFLREYLAASLFRDLGVPAARVTYARVELNGRDLGRYVVTEAMDKQFLTRWFGDANGNLYEGTTQDISSVLEQDHGKDTSQRDRLELFKAVSDDEVNHRLGKLRHLLDVDRFLRYVALEMCLGHWDGYAVNRNNYRIYHDPRTNHMVFIPHGLDSAFFLGVGLRPPPGTPLVERLYSIPEIHREYWRICSNIVEMTWQTEVLTNRINQATSGMLLLARNEHERREWAKASAGFSQLVADRRLELLRFLKGGEIKAIEFDAVGAVKLTGWEAVREVGESIVQRIKTEEGSLLAIEAKKLGATGSWRLMAYVPQGRYLFKAQARLLDWPMNEPFTNALFGIRRSGHDLAFGSLFKGSQWQELSCEVEVLFGGQDLELVCELRADRGTVVFREDFLRLEQVASHPAVWEQESFRPIKANPKKP